MTYFDTSALIKLIVDEPGSDTAAELWDAADMVLSGRLAYPEARSALAAASRAGRLTTGAFARAKRQFEDLWPQLRVIEVTESIAVAAGGLAERLALRGYDAVHLASARAAKGDEPFVLATWDEELSGAALALGLAVAP